jgi:hypothetical protein
MSYIVTSTSGVRIATIADGTINASSTSLTLIGKNYAGYGLFLNDNYVRLLENFANASAPLHSRSGQLWYDSTANILKLYNGTTWKPISSTAASSSSPVSPVTGDLWWDTTNSQLKVRGGSAWITIGPSYTATAGTSGTIVETILDNNSISHVIVKFYISNSVIAILSKDSEFTPQVSITGFDTIKPGLNLISSNTLTGAQFTGIASNALQVNGITGSLYLRSDQNTSTTYRISAGSVAIGNLVIADSSGTTSLTNSKLNGDMNLWVNMGGVNTKAIGINGTTSTATFAGNLVPNANNTLNIGDAGTRFANVYATNFIGTAITSLYADLAERFETDAPLLPGTVVELGGLKEITAAAQELSEAVFGVISTNAGFLMNGAAGSNATHPPVAVNGRVPVRVIGKVNKGDRLVSAGQGLARAALRSEITAFNVIGRALENKETTGIGTVTSVVRINS